ncbi:MAG: hypothetical protein ACI8UX_002407, partial [Psychromonas sp.]
LKTSYFIAQRKFVEHFSSINRLLTTLKGCLVSYI